MIDTLTGTRIRSSGLDRAKLVQEASRNIQQTLVGTLASRFLGDTAAAEEARRSGCFEMDGLRFEIRHDAAADVVELRCLWPVRASSGAALRRLLEYSLMARQADMAFGIDAHSGLFGASMRVGVGFLDGAEEDIGAALIDSLATAVRQACDPQASAGAR